LQYNRISELRTEDDELKTSEVATDGLPATYDYIPIQKTRSYKVVTNL